MRPNRLTDEELGKLVDAVGIYERRGRAGEPPHWYRTAAAWERVKRFLRLAPRDPKRSEP
jgi:hypothetical protein